MVFRPFAPYFTLIIATARLRYAANVTHKRYGTIIHAATLLTWKNLHTVNIISTHNSISQKNASQKAPKSKNMTDQPTFTKAAHHTV